MKLPFFLARRFVAAESIEETLPVAAALKKKGLHVTLDRLGEYVSDPHLAESARDGYIKLVRAIAASDSDIDRNISIKLSMLGQKIDESFCRDNLYQLLDTARETDSFVRLDMEGSDVTESTLSLFETARTEYPNSVGIVLQAYLKRTKEDVQRMCDLNARVRLCKGAYKEPEAIAHQNMSVIRDRFCEYMEMLLASARYPAIATHDDILINQTKAYIQANGVEPSRFEFQMLYGMRADTQIAISKEGFNMRVYVPFGSTWFPYFSRRIRERKENVFFVLKNLIRK
ncbi:MAG: proline dehydrogenase family protein [Rhodothermia bacterium]|nr:MAG: proline dehydrogenase family protein [Rhodothermia bacterium]